ncbi:TadE/TadG family type IV pilus assembly protein [Streptomyces sp. NPDC049040]|uniref:TadE/TadG family type IV pilus assembly protein n=1 Tax=Streptomyces sp. NPDC049040 TaxID=3365593 RepID=UPI0037135BB2
MSSLQAFRRALGGRLAAARGDSGVGRRGKDDRGMTAIEFVFLTPIVFGIIFLTVQFAMYYFAEHVAQAAARAGAREARAQASVHPDDWEDRARLKANGYIDQLGGSLLTSHDINVQRDGDNVSVQVVGHVPSILGIGITVDERSQGPIERFVQGD